MRRNFVEIEHPFIPADHVRLEFPFPDPNPPGFIGEGNALHQPFVDPFGMLQVVNVLNLRNKVEWGRYDALTKPPATPRRRRLRGCNSVFPWNSY